MSRRVDIRPRFGALLLAMVVVLGAPGRTDAQTTVVLDAPGSEAIDTMVQGGSSASINFDGHPLATRASGDLSYVRRALMKFDTETRIPAGSSITSARLTLTVKGGNSETRTLSAYRIVSSFDEATATWAKRKSGYYWSKGGGDFGAKYDDATVTATIGSKVTFDVTRLVQEAVNGAYGSRWTRIAVLDPGGSSRASYREYHSSESSDASVRPTLTVVYGGSSGSTTTTTTTSSTPTTSTPTSSMPSGWSTRDIGSVGIAGYATGSGGTFSVDGGGADIWGSADAFRFAYRQLTGDGSIVARVTGLDYVNAWTKAGVMMRETLTAGSKHAFMLVSPGKGLAFQRRTSTGGSSANTSGGSGTAPAWLKVTRVGSTFSAYKSADGSSWTLVGSATMNMTSTIYVGLAVSSHVSGSLATGNFASTTVSSSTATTTTTTTTTSTPPPTTSTSGSTLKVLHWNVHHGGIGTDGRYDPNRIAYWIAQMNPHVASLNEVDSQDQVDAIVNGVRSKTGVSWSVAFSGRGNLVISRLPLNTKSTCPYATYGSTAAHGSVTMNGRAINLWSTHLHVSDASARLAETKAMQSCALNWNEARIIAGDYNMQQGSTEYNASTVSYSDAWLAAKAIGAATNYSGNCDGCTRNSRIDYMFASKGASWLVMKSAQMIDTRNSSGVMASDHKPLLVTYTVK